MSVIMKQKRFDEIVRELDRTKGVLVLGCHGCAEDSSTGGPDEVKEMMEKLRKKNIKVYCLEDQCMEYMCWEKTVEERFQELDEKINKFDTILLLSCGTGVSCLNDVLKKHDLRLKIVPGTDPVGIGHVPIKGQGEITCWLCGNCSLIKDESGYYVCRVLFEKKKV